MRNVEIIQEQAGVRPYKAIDRETRQALLSLRDPAQLHDICKRLEWRIIINKKQAKR
jgi:hypothetical protein